jgi:putative ABC transport system permease protein
MKPSKNPSPPRLAVWLVKRLDRYQINHAMIDDMHEVFLRIWREQGYIFACFWYWGQCLDAVIKDTLFNSKWRVIMIKNYLKIAFRNLTRQKGYSFINITGLAIGMACAIFILLWVQDELSYDGFHKNKDNIFRVAALFENEGNEVYGTQTSAPVAPFLKNNYPEIQESTTVNFGWLTGNSRNIIKFGEKSFYTNDLILTDPSFFDIFSFPFLKGDKNTALENPNSVILTLSTAEKCFGSEDPINKTIQVDGNPVIVTGVVADVPHNSYLQFDVLLPLTSVRNTNRGFFLTKWDSYGFGTYVTLQDGVAINELDRKIENVIRNNDSNFGDTAAYIFLQPLSKIRLFNVDGSVGFMRYVYIFSTIAVIILLIACFNYMNLSTARSDKRAKEIGLRKVVGSKRANIIWQFFSESLLYAFISFLISILIVILFLPLFNELTGKQIAFDYANPGLLFGFVFVALLTGIIAGSYPALYLSSFIPIEILNKSKSPGTKKSPLRKVLVVFQFALSIGLIISMTVVSGQVKYMRNAEIGFEKDNAITLPISGKIENIFESFKNELKQNPGIVSVSLKSTRPLSPGGTSGTISWEGKNPEQQINWCHPMVDHDYFKTLNMKIVEGRDFSREIQSDLQEGFILNEEAVRQGNIEDPVGKQITVNGENGIIIGVVKNAQLSSLRFTIQPVVYHLSQTFREEFQTLFIKMGSGENDRQFDNIAASLAHIERVWKKFMPDAPFEYQFLDESLGNQYRTEIRISRILNTFTVLAIFLSCLGLLGLTSFMAEQRTKEIGVRKVLGASVTGIVILLSKEFAKWVLLANVIAWPLAYYFMSQWIQEFSYRINLGIGTFIASAVIAFIIALLTVSFLTIKAALANPIESLRYE